MVRDQSIHLLGVKMIGEDAAIGMALTQKEGVEGYGSTPPNEQGDIGRCHWGHR